MRNFITIKSNTHIKRKPGNYAFRVWEVFETGLIRRTDGVMQTAMTKGIESEAMDALRESGVIEAKYVGYAYEHDDILIKGINTSF